VLPLDDRSLAELVAVKPEAMIPPGGVYKYYPGTLEIPEFAAANTRGRSYKILAQVEIADADARGVIYAQGARFGGYSLFVKERKLCYAYNFIGIPPEQQLVSDREIDPGEHVLGVEFVKQSVGDRHETHGTAKLYIDDQVVAEAPLRAQLGHFALCGEGLSIGRDSSDPVSGEYPGGFKTILRGGNASSCRRVRSGSPSPMSRGRSNARSRRRGSPRSASSAAAGRGTPAARR
jgi:catechol 2,3-dioxygenase-like lactoylglutathione lyase family enzyme